MNSIIDLLGVYNVRDEKDVYLLEFYIKSKYTEVEIGKFSQAQENIDPLNWQSPWEEKYLNNDGTVIIGDWLDLPEEISDDTRVVFFLHFLDFTKPLLTPFGEIELKLPEVTPDRLSSIKKYERPD
jgi:hypothetical protein